MRIRKTGVAALSVSALVASVSTVLVAPGAAADRWTACVSGPVDRQATFGRAAEASGVPREVLLAVSFMESRWDAHGDSPSTSGGYGPMHLSDVEFEPGVDPKAALRGESGSAESDRPPTQRTTLDQAIDLTGLSAARLRADDVSNICGGAAVLASYQRSLAPGRMASADVADWTPAIATYSGAADQATAARFTRQVFAVLREGHSRTTNDGFQVGLTAHPQARFDRRALESLGLVEPHDDVVDCPRTLGCESIPAPYEWYDTSSPYSYGNHDVARRPRDMDIDYIVIHNTEGNWERALELVTDPEYLAWHYTLRSRDGLVAQHVNNKNVGWQAGNWYVNMHSIGLEHEGYAAQGAKWFTESVYRSSASLVGYLARKYDVPVNRAHIIGHDQVPGTTQATVQGMHWDPGPYWDWQHYMELLGAAAPRAPRASDVVRVAPEFETNRQRILGCETDGLCPSQGTNFAYLHTKPWASSPLVKDVGLRPDGSYSTRDVSDIGARAVFGHKFFVAERRGDWLGVWYLGKIAWLKKHADQAPMVARSTGRVVLAKGAAAVPVYGRAYPEESAYPAEIPYQPVEPLQYTIKPGQAYVLADASLSTDYYYAKTYDDSLPGDHTVVVGEDEYYQIWFGHRVGYVRAADVKIVRALAARP